MKVAKISGKTNADVARELRDVASMAENDERPIAAWAVTLVVSDGSAGSVYGGPDELGLIGALDVTKKRVVEGW